MKFTLRSNHPAKGHSFFKIILSDQINPQSKLMIPEKFVRNQEEELQGRVVLKTPGGAAWPVDVERKKGKVLLQNGWPEFATFYSLCFGSLLVFDYMGHCNFQVRVFDTSATEIDYPSTCNPNLNDEDLVPEARKRVADIDDSPRCELIRACKKPRESSEKTFHNGPKLKQEKANGDRGSASKEGKERALDLAKAFKSENPFFILRMRPSYVVGHSVEITKTFQEAYRKWKNRDQVILQVASRTWPVDCSLNGDRCTLNGGWNKFKRDNSLNLGDVCVFELINPSTKLFKVFIFRANVKLHDLNFSENNNN